MYLLALFYLRAGEECVKHFALGVINCSLCMFLRIFLFLKTDFDNPKGDTMTDRKIRIAVLATGARAQVVIGHLLKQAEGRVEIASVFDPDAARVDEALARWKAGPVHRATSYEEAVATLGEGPDRWVFVFSPNVHHKEQILHAFQKGAHVFAEKPLATRLEDCAVLHEAHARSGLFFATGFVLRYAPIYRKAHEILSSGRLGRILSIQANENIAPAHGGYIFRNWRRHTALAGSHLLEKCCHDLDLLNWFAASLPTKVSGFASRDFFRAENKPLLDKYGAPTFMLWPDPAATGTPFDEDTDLTDTHVAALLYRNGIKVTFQATASNALPERRMYFSCSEGTLILEVYSGLLTWQGLGDAEPTVLEMKDGLHGGGDRPIMAALLETMTEGVPPLCSGEEGLESAAVALALDEAAETGRVVDLEPVWKQLGR